MGIDPVAKQTEETLRRLFEIPADLELLRDFQSPHDELVTDTEAVFFEDGPVFAPSAPPSPSR